MDASEKYVKELEKRIDIAERDTLGLIEKRDAAEYTLGYMYRAVTGRLPYWSNMLSYDNAIEEVWSMSLSDSEAGALRDVVNNFIELYQYNNPALDSAMEKLNRIIGDI